MFVIIYVIVVIHLVLNIQGIDFIHNRCGEEI